MKQAKEWEPTQMDNLDWKHKNIDQSRKWLFMDFPYATFRSKC